VTKSWEDSTLNRIVQLTEEGQLIKPKLQRWLDEFGEYYSRVVVALSLAVALLGPLLFKWPLFGNSGNPLMLHCCSGPVSYLCRTYYVLPDSSKFNKLWITFLLMILICQFY